MTTPSGPPEQDAAGLPKLAEAFAQLRTLLQDAGQLVQVLEARMRELGAAEERAADDPERRVRELEQQLAAAEADREELVTQLVDAEQQAGKLMSLYVATYQLHVSLDPVEVQTAIAEITKDLLGAESFVLLIKDEIEGGCEIALSQGPVAESGAFGGEHYDGGDPVVDATLGDGVMRLEQNADSDALAAVPLRVEDAIVGALVILKMLEHKVTPLAEDRDILDLLAAHAASALFAARVYSKTDRKLRTLESLVGLIRGT